MSVSNARGLSEKETWPQYLQIRLTRCMDLTKVSKVEQESFAHSFNGSLYISESPLRKDS